ncbi:MAG: bacterial transcriptional activator domain-containing protein, partial [Anaerolineae bacterium]|nr:bacterial transcriptional activator domain-containing protein [Anaerolineae bacterium]
LEKACALYKGDYLDGMSFPNDEWCFWRREELGRRYHTALQRLGDLRVERADYAGALEAYRRLIAHDPLREDIHRAIMRCLAQSGDRSAALRHYRTVVTLLRDELAVEPLPETSELYRMIAEGREERV